MAIAFGPDELKPAVIFELLLQFDGILDLLQLELHDFRVVVTIGMHLGENIVSLFNLALGNEETRAFRYEPDE